MLIHAILLPTLAVHTEEPAHRHPRLVVLMKEPAGLAFHTEAPEPVTTHRLPEALPPRRVDIRVGLRRRGGLVFGLGDERVGLDRGAGGQAGVGGRGDGGGVEAALEVEVEDSVGVLHWWNLGVLLGFGGIKTAEEVCVLGSRSGDSTEKGEERIG